MDKFFKFKVGNSDDFETPNETGALQRKDPNLTSDNMMKKWQLILTNKQEVDINEVLKDLNFQLEFIGFLKN